MNVCFGPTFGLCYGDQVIDKSLMMGVMVDGN
jgi:hypothetical protein